MTVKGTVTAFTLVVVSLGATNAQSQSDTYIDYSHPNVTIDLSVIGDSGYQRPANTAAPSLGQPSGRVLLVPGAQAPSSMLHLPTVSGAPLPQLKKPKIVQDVDEEPAPMVAKAPVVKAAPPPAPVEATAPAPAQVSAPVPMEVAETPKKLEAPAKPAVSAPPASVENESPPPAPVVKPVVDVAKIEAPAAPAAASEQASLPPSGAQIDTGSLRVTFGDDQTKLPAASRDDLKALAEKMKGQDDLRLQLMAYAGGPSLSSSLARRMSLSRALSVRSFLIENGVRSTRIDVRALGNKTTEEPVNRVDLNVAER